MVKIGVIQFSPVLGDLETNRQKILRLIPKAAEKGASIIVLPELAFSGYNFEDAGMAEACSERVPGGASFDLCHQLAKWKDLFIVSGISETARGNLYNSSFIVGKEGLIAKYRKTHLYKNEKNFFSKGKGTSKIFDLGGLRAGLMICFDWFFPEVARNLALNGADVIFHPANLVIEDNGAFLGDVFHSKWNRVYTVLADRCGQDGDCSFLGRSRIIDPDGRVIAKAPKGKEAIIVADIDPSKARDKRLNEFNDLFKDA